MMLAELDAVNYTYQQANLARAWILYGDWRFKGANPTLELSDFFVAEDRLESIRHTLSSKYFLLTSEEFDQHMKRSYADGYDRAMTDNGAKTAAYHERRIADSKGEKFTADESLDVKKQLHDKVNALLAKHGLSPIENTNNDAQHPNQR